MNVRSVIIKAFRSEWSRLREEPSTARTLRTEIPIELELAHLIFASESVFDFDSIQRVVDEDLGQLKDRDRYIRERYHGNNLRFLSRHYAQNLYILRQQYEGDVNHYYEIREGLMREALEQIKIAWSCPVYPCQRV